jgi:very-short-patch-repair endonuclease
MLKDKVKCEICGEMFGQLNGHIKKHGLRGKEYRDMFPNSPMESQAIVQSKYKKLSESNRGRESPFKGKKHSATTKAKIKEARAKQVFDDNWHKNHMAGVVKGEEHWTKSDEWKDQHANGSNNSFYGRKHSEESKRLMSENNAAKRLEVKQKLGEAMKARWERGEVTVSQRNTRTKPHMIAIDLLNELGVRFVEEKPVRSFRFDFYLPEYRAYIEANGDYFHGNPTRYKPEELNQQQLQRMDNDKKKAKIVQNRPILYLWNSDLQLNRDVCKLLIQKFISGELFRVHSYEYTGGYENYDKNF